MAGDEPATWPRKGGLRQGSVLQPEAANALGLVHPAHPDDTCVLVVSHSCDIASTDLLAEPNVEVIVGRRLPSVSGSFTKTKSPRQLHLPVTMDGAPIGVELRVTGKTLVPKVQLLPWRRPDDRFSLDDDALKTLQTWLAIRYMRSAFPDEFDRRMKHVTNVESMIERIATKYDPVISALYFRLNRRDEIGEDDPTPYILNITVMFEPGDDAEKNQDIADAAAAEIDEAFKKRCYDADSKQWKYIHCENTKTLSEDDAVVSRVKKLQQRRLDHISLEPGTESAQTPPF
jgi:hypothetical protein